MQSAMGGLRNQTESNMTTDQKIAALRPGQSVRLTGDSRRHVVAERSGNGKTVRFVRIDGRTSTVFRTVAF